MLWICVEGQGETIENDYILGALFGIRSEQLQDKNEVLMFEPNDPFEDMCLW